MKLCIKRKINNLSGGTVLVSWWRGHGGGGWGMFGNGLMPSPSKVNSLSPGSFIRWPRSMAQTHLLPPNPLPPYLPSSLPPSLHPSPAKQSGQHESCQGTWQFEEFRMMKTLRRQRRESCRRRFTVSTQFVVGQPKKNNLWFHKQQYLFFLHSHAVAK